MHLRSPATDVLFDEVWKLCPHLVILDATHSRKLTEDVRWLKSLSLIRPTLFTAFCKDEAEVKEGESLLSAGVTLFHLKDTESASFFRDCFQIAFDGPKLAADFARAKNLEIPLSLSFLSVLTCVDTETFTLETDLTLQETVKLSLPMLEGETELSMEITKQNDGGITAPYMKTYEGKFPFAGPWEELNENSLQPATIETWIELRKERFDARKKHLCLFTCNDQFTSELHKRTSASWYQIFRNAEEAQGRLYHSRPGVIFYDLQCDDGTDLRQISELIGAIKEIDPSPMLVIFGSRSDSPALRKIYHYEFILTVPARLDIATFLAFEKSFLSRKSSEDEKFYLAPDDPERIICLKTPVIMTSLTERNMTFILDAEIPYYTVAKIDLPIPTFLTIIPAEGQLAASKKGTHYQAIIHGIAEENIARLRKIVNQLIYQPVSVLTPESVENMLHQDYVPKPKAPEAPPPMISRKDTLETTDPADERFTVKRNLKGKSKL